MSNPPAHRRLVPRKTRKDPEDPGVTKTRAPAAQDDNELQDVSQATAVRRSALLDPLDILDLTAENELAGDGRGLDDVDLDDPVAEAPVAVAVAAAAAVAALDDDDDDDDDAGETMSKLLAQDSTQREVDANAFLDLEPTGQRPPRPSSVSPAPAAPAPTAPRARKPLPIPATTEIGTDARSKPPTPAAGMARRLSAGHAVRPEEDAFADSEPTGLKQASVPGLEDRPTAHLSPAELGLLSAMSEGHEPSRLKYCEWLDRRGEKSRAEFLRLDYALATMSPEHPKYDSTRRRMCEVAPHISVDWRSRVARSLIENCTAYGSGCPAYWRALPATSDDVRQCSACGDQVYYCVTIELARARVKQGQRVAVDATCTREIGDLEHVCVACHARVPPNNRYCPQCGHAL